MNLNYSSLDKALEKHFIQLQERVKFRLNSENSLDWLLKPQNELPYQPDYLTTSSAGRTRFEQSFNRLLSRLFPKLWFKVFWPKITKSLISYTEDKYYKKIFHQITDSALILETQKYISTSLKTLLSKNWKDLRNCTFTELSNCILAVIHEPLKQLPIEQDIFLPDKKTQNEACLNLLKQIRPSLLNSKTKLDTLVYLSCRANWIDSLEDNPEKLLKEFVDSINSNWMESACVKNMPFNSTFYQIEKFKQTFNSTSGAILYEFDNCGELIFDLCLIEEFISRGRKVYFCVKGCPMVNDVMEKDLLEVLEDDLFSNLKSELKQGNLLIVTAGNFIGGGKLVHDINEEYRKAYQNSDLVIIKGQGNFQSMPIAGFKSGRVVPYQYQNPVIYMTGIKADLIQMCLTALYSDKNTPPKNSILLYVAD